MSIEKIYEYLHQNPELSYQEFNTTKFLLEQIKEYNLNIFPLVPTGFIAVTKNASKEYLLYRTDIDALPISEKTNSAYASINSGVMHACGHDIHMSSLLLFIKQVMPKINDLEHNLVFVFQPAEEKFGGGKDVVKQEIIKQLDIKACHAVHVWPHSKLNTLITKPGTLLSTNRTFQIKFSGLSSHAATPQKAKPVLQVALDFINHTNVVLAKQHDPFEPLIINIGKINGGTATNIIIDELSIEGTIRSTLDRQIEEVETNIKKYLETSAISNEIEINYELQEQPYPTVTNDLNLLNKVRDETWQNLEFPSLASEDFGFYKQIAPSLMVFVGTDTGENESLHSDSFLPNPEVIHTIAKLYMDILDKHENN